MRMKITKKDNKSFVFLLIIIMLCGNMLGLNFGANVVYAVGDLPNANSANGTQTKPYIINEASDFTWVFENSSARSSYLLQTADIDLSGFAWTPIGQNNATPFTGSYNGNGYTISNMTQNDGNMAYLGMFGYTSNATIKNVTLFNVSFTGGQMQNQAAIGAIAGMTTGTTLIERCHVTGTSSIIGATNDTIGGIVGSNGASIKYCSSSATVSSSNYDSGSKPNSGGIAGSNWGAIDNSFNRGNVSCGTGTAAGGIVGFGYSNVLSNCYSTGTVTVAAGSEGGAIIGNITDAVNVSGNYYLSGVATNGIGKLDLVAGPSETGTTATSSADLKLQGTYIGWDFAGNTWVLQSGVNNDYPFIKGVAPVAVTIEATALTVTTGTVGGDVTSTGYGTISEKGIEHTKSAENSFTTVIASTSGTGIFSVDLSGLTPNTTYYVRAYAVNEVGTSYGEPILFITNPLAPQLPLNLLQGSIVGTTKAVISDMTTDRFVANITDVSVGYVEAGDTAPSFGPNFIDNYVSGSDIFNGVVVGKYLQIYDVDNLGEVVKFTEIQINNGHIKADNIILPINEGFENGGSIPSNWGQQTVNSLGSNVNWTFIHTSTEDLVTATPYAGGYMAKADFYNSDEGASARLNLIRNFSLPEGGSYEFSFYMFHSTENDYGADDAVQPQISLNDGNVWTDLGTQIRRITGDTGWVKHTISLDAYAGESNVRVGFLAISNYGYSVFFDDVEIRSLELDAKALTADSSSNDVDHDIEIAFGADAGFEGAITGVSFNGTALTVTTDYVVGSGKITLKPSGGNAALQTPATGNVVITATGYTNSTVSQTIEAGQVASLTVTQEPLAGAASGNDFATQPVITMKDQYDNICSNGPSATANVVATAKAGTGIWTIGGTTTKEAVAGITTFTDVTCTLTAPGNGAMTFASGLVTTDSSTFNIPEVAAKVLTADTTNNNVDYDIEVTFGADAGFEGAITGVSFNGTALTVTTDYVVGSGKITLKPSGGNAALQTPATGNVVITATGYTNSTVSQTIEAGQVASLTVTQEPLAGAASGNDFATQPVITMKDQYDNICSNGPSATANVVATAKAGTGIWTIGGTTTKEAVAGITTFTDVTCTLTAPGSGAMTFASGLVTTDSSTFNIPEVAAKVLTADTTNNNVDYNIEVTFGADAGFEGAIAGVSFNGTALTVTTDYVVGSGKITLKPSGGNAALQTPAIGNVVITATGYTNSTVSQTIEAGQVASLTVTQEPVTGAASGNAFAAQPVITMKDQYDNICSNGLSATANVVVTAKAGTGTWTIGGTTTKEAVAGITTFTDVTCTLTAPGNGAMTFASGLVTTDSSTFNIPEVAAKVLAADTTNNNVDYDIEVTFGADAGFEGAITGVSFNGTALTVTTDYVVGSGKIMLKPSGGNAALQTPVTGNVVITATGYTNSTVSQTIEAGQVASLTVTQEPVAGAASGNDLATQPVITMKDQYDNICSNGPSATANVVATAKAGTGIWTIGGTTTKEAVAGITTFTDVTCTLTAPGNGAMTFASGLVTIDSSTFNIPEVAAKVLAADTTNNNVDYDIEVTFGADAGFEGAITGVSFNGTALTVTTDYVVGSGKIMLKPSGGNAALQTPATGNVVITATGYTNSTVSQTIEAGQVASLTVTQEPVAGAASGNDFATQPVITMKDQYDNICSNGPSATANVVATAKAGTGIWTIGGTTIKEAVAGITTFTDVTCTLTAPGNGAMTFASGLVTTDSSTFNIPEVAAKVLTADTTNNNVDYYIEVTFGADAGFEGAITGVSFNGTALTVTTDYVVGSGKITLKPSGGNAALQTPATGNVVITATGYTNSTVSQTINHGAVEELYLTQDITAPTSNGGQFARQPILTMKDQYGNTCTNNNGDKVTASKKDTGEWTLTGTLIKTVVDGTVAFTDLGATNTAQVNNTQIGFNVTGLTEVSSMAVTLPGPASSGGGNNSISEITPQPTGTSDVEVLVNGQSESAGTATTTTVDNRTTTIITVDTDKLQQRLESEGNHAVVTIPVNTNADVVVGELNGQMVKNMETKQAVVEVKTETATYTVPARQINIDAISEQVGENVELKDIKVQIEISKASDETVQVFENASNNGKFTIVVPPMEFTIKCIHNNKTYEVSKFNAYVERTVSIPEGVDPSKITTGIVIEPDGTVRHVPTKIILIDGKYYAKINSLTNSTYTVVYNPIEFKDVANHWAKDAINDMGSRMVISGIGKGMFEPNRDITRAEFAAIIVRALGLKPGTSINPFSDVSNNDWYKNYVETAYGYGIISGYGNNKFGSMDKITREQAMTMIANAMKITGLEVELTREEINTLLAGFGDSGQSSEWAKESLATCLKTEIVSGKGSNILAPKDNITRAEVAVIVKRMLQKSKLI